MDYALISGTLSALATLRELGQSAIGIRDAAQISTIVVQMNDQVLNVQSNLSRHQTELLDLQQKYHEAIEELRRLKERQVDRDRYELAEPHPGTYVYRLKPGIGSEPSHMLCQACFDAGTKSILQRRGAMGGCHACKATVRLEVTRTQNYGPTFG